MHFGIKKVKILSSFSQLNNTQSVTCLATDASLAAGPGAHIRSWPGLILSLRLIMEYFLRVILLPSAESFKKGCCQLQAKVCARSTG